MRCPYCQENIRVQGRFCPKCGQQIFGLPVRRETPGAPAPAAPQAPTPPRPPSAPPYRPFGAPPDLSDDGIVIESDAPATSAPTPQAPVGVHPTAAEEIGKTCPYCRFPLKPGEQVMTCPACKLPHHADCWSENQGCTTYGCRGVAPAPAFGGAPRQTPAPGPVGMPRPDVLGDLGFNPQEAELDGRATTALIIAILGLLICCLPGPGVVAIVMGARVLAEANLRRLPASSPRSKATWAIALGIIGIVGNIIAMVMLAGRASNIGA